MRRDLGDQRLEFVERAVDGEIFGAGAARRGIAGVGQRFVDGGGERGGIARRNEAAVKAIGQHLFRSAAAGGDDTRHLVNASVLQALGPNGFLVNVARGSVVDEAALLQALQQGQIAGAGLDVFEDEPHPLPGLLQLDNVVLAPHTASQRW